MRRQAPPLEAIEAFILATRSASFREAADRLALSPSAFSRRVQTLEAFVGTPLFVREKGAAVLTRTGERYLRTVEPAIDAIRRATVDLRAERGGSALRVIVPQSFALAWLIPNLPALQCAHPDIQVELRVGRSITDLRRGHADVAVLASGGAQVDLPSQRLATLAGILVSAPRLADGRAPPQTLDALPAYDRLAVYRPEGIWESWLDGVGYTGDALPAPTYYEAHFLMIEAAAAGLGVAVTPPLMAERLLADGRLVQPLPCKVSIGVEYRLVFADAQTSRRSDVVRFGRWLADGMARHDAALISES